MRTEVALKKWMKNVFLFDWFNIVCHNQNVIRGASETDIRYQISLYFSRGTTLRICHIVMKIIRNFYWVNWKTPWVIPISNCFSSNRNMILAVLVHSCRNLSLITLLWTRNKKQILLIVYEIKANWSVYTITHTQRKNKQMNYR